MTLTQTMIDNLAEAIADTLSRGRVMKHFIPTHIAPHLREEGRDAALRIADAITPSSCFTSQLANDIGALIEHVNARIIEGTTEVPFENVPRIVIGRYEPPMVKEYDTAATALRIEIVALVEFMRMIIGTLDLATTIKVSRQLIDG